MQNSSLGHDNFSPLELLNLYYSEGRSTGNKTNRLWYGINRLLCWDNVLHYGYQADLCPLLYYIVAKALPLFGNNIISKDIVRVLEKHYHNHLVRNLILLNELKKVRDLFQERRLDLIVLKGGDLAENVYEDIACRPMGDLDILIRRGDRRKAYLALGEMGYISQKANQQDTLIHQVFRKQIGHIQVKVEIHHQLAKQVFKTDFSLEQIFADGMMSLEYQMVYLSWHMVNHGVVRLIWLCDLAEIVKKHRNQIHWPVVEEMKNSFMVGDYLTISKRLVSDLLASPGLTSAGQADRFSVTYRLLEELHKRLKNGRETKLLRNLFRVELMQHKDLATFIPRYLLHKYLVHSGNRLEKRANRQSTHLLKNELDH